MYRARTAGQVLSVTVAIFLTGVGLVLLPGCPGNPVAECSTDADCDDNNPCTADSCGTNGTCVNEAIPCPEEPIDLAALSEEEIGALDVESTITSVTIASPPVINFTVSTASGTPITGIGALWEADDRFVRFTATKLVMGLNGDPNSWVAYTRETTNDGSTAPNYDTGSTFVDHGDGTYTFTFATNVSAVTGVTYEPTLSHRIAGQIGSGDSALEPQNLVYDFVPAGGTIVTTRNIAVMSSCNECHEDLMFHGRRFKVEYCVNCHNPDLAEGEGDMAYMTHKIHASQKFNVLDDGVDYAEVTYPQSLTNCRKCHTAELEATPDGDNWKTVPSMSACGSCHQISFTSPAPEGLTLHSGGAQANNATCATCHPASGGLSGIEDAHLTANATPNNPNLPAGVPALAYAISDVTVDAGGVPTVTFAITADGAVLDLNNLPDAFVDDTGAAFSWPGFLMAYALPQEGVVAPADYNNLGRSAAQPATVSLGALVAAGGVDCSATDCVADFSATANAFPAGAQLRAIGLQGYFQIDTDGDEALDTPLHTPAAVLAATGDTVRRTVVESTKCASCHEWFEGHGGNRVYEIAICTMCHVPNLSTSGRDRKSGRAIDPLLAVGSGAAASLGNTNTATWPEDTNNLKEMIHGIHASAVRSTDYEFVRNRLNGLYFNWAEVTFPAANGTRNCLLCHAEGTFELPLADNLLATTVRTSATDDGLDGNAFAAVGAARASLTNDTDWVNSPTASSCAYCHDSTSAVAHMRQNGGTISIADFASASFTHRQDVVTVESCTVCHGSGKVAAVGDVHGVQ